MKRTILLTLVALLFFVVGANSSFACSCEPPRRGQASSFEQEVEKGFSSADAVFIGKVISFSAGVKAIYGKYKYYTFPPRRAKIRIEKRLKGSLPRVVTVETGLGGADCGYPFRVGKQFLIYAYAGDKNVLSTGLCSRTALLSEAVKERKILEEIQSEEKVKCSQR